MRASKKFFLATVIFMLITAPTTAVFAEEGVTASTAPSASIAPAATSSTAPKFVQDTVDSVLQVLKANAKQLKNCPKIEKQLYEKLAPKMCIQDIVTFVVGQPFLDKGTAEQNALLYKAYNTFFISSYGRVFQNFNDKIQVKVIQATRKTSGDYQQVNTIIDTGNDQPGSRIPVAIIVKKMGDAKHSSWCIADLVIDSVDQLSTTRDQNRALLSRLPATATPQTLAEEISKHNRTQCVNEST